MKYLKFKQQTGINLKCSKKIIRPHTVKIPCGQAYGLTQPKVFRIVNFNHSSSPKSLNSFDFEEAVLILPAFMSSFTRASPCCHSFV